jgi:hypothetical protein
VCHPFEFIPARSKKFPTRPLVLALSPHPSRTEALHSPGVIERIAVANIDVDMYEAVRSALIKTAPRIASGGILIVEDPGHTPALIGSRLALEEFMATPIAAAFTPVYMESGQTLLIRNR